MKKEAENLKEQLNFYKKAFSDVVGIGNIGVFSNSLTELMNMSLKLHGDRAIPALIEGETGTGKEIIARKIHYGEGNTNKPFITINCSSISATLFESELFGYDEGSFTGAKKQGHIGKLEAAQGGTIFLDEIGDMPLDLQPKLLRAIEYGEIYRVGSNKKIKLDIRVICASNQNILDLCKRWLFRSDLYYRLSVAKLYIPPLRERIEEILPLAQMFLTRYASAKNKKFNSFAKDTIQLLLTYSWPGNVRELENAIERVVLMNDDYEVKSEFLYFLEDETMYNTGNVLRLGKIVLPNEPININEIEKEIVAKAMKKFNNNKSKVAEYLGITRSALRSRMD